MASATEAAQLVSQLWVVVFRPGGDGKKLYRLRISPGSDQGNASEEVFGLEEVGHYIALLGKDKPTPLKVVDALLERYTYAQLVAYRAYRVVEPKPGQDQYTIVLYK